MVVLAPSWDNNPAGTTAAYIGTDDIDATLAKHSLGGRDFCTKTEISGMAGSASSKT